MQDGNKGSEKRAASIKTDTTRHEWEKRDEREMSAVRDIQTDAEWAAAWSACQPGQLIALDFWAEWCAPCSSMDNIFRQLAPSLAPSAQAWRVDAETCAGAAETFDVEAVPTFVLVRVKEGKRAFDILPSRVEGADPAALAAAFAVWGEIASASVPAPASASASASAPASASVPLDQRLAALVSSAPVMLFMKGTRAAPECGFSRKIVEILNEVRVPYETFNILQDEEVRQGLKAFSNWPTFPQLYADGKLIGGLDIVKELHAEGELADALKSSSVPVSLNDRLKQLINTDKVMLFMKGVPGAPECGFSRSIVDILNRNTVKFSSFNILADDEVRQGLKEFSNWPTFPQLYSNGKLVGGLDIVKELDAEGELRSELGQG